MEIINDILNDFRFWSIFYLIASVTFAQKFKKSNRKMKDAGSLTILLEVFTAFFALLLIPFFEWKFVININVIVVIIAVVIIYAITDRLNIEARYGLDPSVFSMLKQLSTVFLMIFGFIFLKEEIIIKKIIGASIIIFANLLLTLDNGKIKINKYFIMCFVSNFLFAIAMLINVNISDHFNLPFYTIMTVFLPSVLIFIFGRHTIKGLKKEFKRLKKGDFLVASFCWALMLIASVRAYQLGDVTIVAPILTLTSILNALYEFFICHNKKNFRVKLIASLLIILGVLLIRFS
jgi:drug/metabolite transporter (DMT)-like permease